jgi:hypothetical protein
MLLAISVVLDMSLVLYVPNALHDCPTGDVSHFEEDIQDIVEDIHTHITYHAAALTNLFQSLY